MEKLRAAAISLTKSGAYFALYLLLQILSLYTVPREYRAALTLALLLPVLFAVFRLRSASAGNPLSGSPAGNPIDSHAGNPTGVPAGKLTGVPAGNPTGFTALNPQGFKAFLGWRRPRYAALPLCLLLGMALNIVMSNTLTLISLPSELVEAYNEASAPLTSGGVMTVVGTVLFAPLLEETVYRGLLLSRLCTGFPVWAALLISSAVFGLMHGNIIWVCYAAVSGLELGALFLMTRSAAACAVAHIGFNGVNYLLMLFPPPGLTHGGALWLGIGLTVSVLCFLGIYLISSAPSRKPIV